MINLGRKEQIMILVIMAVILFSAGYQFAARSDKQPMELVTSQPGEDLESTQENQGVVVHVAGAVEKPGVYQLSVDSRVNDALKLAVPTADADLNLLNLAAPLKDGQKLQIPNLVEPTIQGQSPAQMPTVSVPVQGAAPVVNNPIVPSVTPGNGLININTASLAELDTLPGIGPALADRIIQHREANGPFQTIEDLKSVSGIGDKKFGDLQQRVTVQ
ncbi:ComEA family DNA-binding protein [Desulfotomaculum sp. 1211_IL3151]|uniref:ComEA family DNA-binding protein n=1 Tax=Desulfotomaculum sp. 1211_IL3151 TaxID=3084055 RepID=UPI002FD9DE7E